ncbi:MAG: DUF4258 domain-containing protein [Caldilinea sp. CFX5]|nr:DUF4258 domain-containing protein [Caldilinea sp. CFX5]
MLQFENSPGPSLIDEGSFMQIRYNTHARQRMRERKVSETMVEETLDSPDELSVGEQDEWIAVRHYGNRRLQIVYGEIDEETVLIYTVISIR